MENPLITYPCTWSYRLIGEDGELMVREIPGKMGCVKHEISFANRSRQGKYVSINIEAVVSSDEERLSVAARLRCIPSVKMVM
jgi:putative lipoic acid-binding regulatory protein